MAFRQVFSQFYQGAPSTVGGLVTPSNYKLGISLPLEYIGKVTKLDLVVDYFDVSDTSGVVSGYYFYDHSWNFSFSKLSGESAITPPNTSGYDLYFLDSSAEYTDFISSLETRIVFDPYNSYVPADTFISNSVRINLLELTASSNNSGVVNAPVIDMFEDFTVINIGHGIDVGTYTDTITGFSESDIRMAYSTRLEIEASDPLTGFQ